MCLRVHFKTPNTGNIRLVYIILGLKIYKNTKISLQSTLLKTQKNQPLFKDFVFLLSKTL